MDYRIVGNGPKPIPLFSWQLIFFPTFPDFVWDNRTACFLNAFHSFLDFGMNRSALSQTRSCRSGSGLSRLKLLMSWLGSLACRSILWQLLFMGLLGRKALLSETILCTWNNLSGWTLDRLISDLDSSWASRGIVDTCRILWWVVASANLLFPWAHIRR